MIIDINSKKMCAICKYWYDPAYIAVSPKNSRLNLWNIDDKVKNKCMKSNLETKATSRCMKFEKKDLFE